MLKIESNIWPRLHFISTMFLFDLNLGEMKLSNLIDLHRTNRVIRKNFCFNDGNVISLCLFWWMNLFGINTNSFWCANFTSQNEFRKIVKCQMARFAIVQISYRSNTTAQISFVRLSHHHQLGPREKKTNLQLLIFCQIDFDSRSNISIYDCLSFFYYYYLAVASSVQQKGTNYTLQMDLIFIQSNCQF